ncbi:MAG TPA: hypothetical protein VK513_14480 [Terriglobales bacterium]|nr:hypothetical protein [Terriglobales bacterium]
MSTRSLGFAETLADSYHVYRTTPRRYGASSQIASGSAEQRLTADDLRVLDALKLLAPLMVAGND